MAHAYTPGLKVVEETVLDKERKLPLAGEVLVKKGEPVEATQIVARTHLPGNVVTINVANKLGLPPEDVPHTMLKKKGEAVKKGEIIAESKGLFGLFTSKAEAPVEGTIESVSEITGQIILREPPEPVQINAYIRGWVKEVIPREGVIVETVGSFIQGIFGVGGEVHGEIEMAAKSPSEVLTDKHIKPSHKGKILVGGARISRDAIKSAENTGVIGIIGGGMDDSDLREILGFDLGVAITGKEDIPTTIVITEGFGNIAMADATFKLLNKRAGLYASMNGATQIRAGVIRPEIVIPLEKASSKRDIRSEAETSGNLVVGSWVRAIREPYFGRLGVVTELPPELTKLETEAMVRVLKVKFEDNKKEVVIPRANVELIET